MCLSRTLMLDNPEVSIILTNHNKWPYIRESINSILNQSHVNWELIIVSDSCNDASVDYVAQVNDKRVKKFNVDFKNAAKSRNFGFEKSSGKFIQYFDADDILAKKKIETQLESLRTNKLGLSVCRTLAISEDGTFMEEIDREFLDEPNPIEFIFSLYSNPYRGMVQPNAWLFSRELHEIAGIWNENLTLDDDGEFFCRIILKSERIIFCNEILNFYRKFRKINHSLSSLKNLNSLESGYLSAVLKVEYLLNCGKFSKKQIDKVNASFFSVIASDSYLINQKVYKMSMKKCNLAGCFYNPYPGGVSYFFSSLIGWRVVKVIKFLKYKITPKIFYFL